MEHEKLPAGLTGEDRKRFEAITSQETRPANSQSLSYALMYKSPWYVIARALRSFWRS